jgi:hypothetical protein
MGCWSGGSWSHWSIWGNRSNWSSGNIRILWILWILWNGRNEWIRSLHYLLELGNIF